MGIDRYFKFLFLTKNQENSIMGGPLINFRSMIIEMLGTMFLCWYGGMAISVASYQWNNPTTSALQSAYPLEGTEKGDKLFGIALCHGLILGIWIYAGAAAGADCHFNPAVTVGFILGRRCGFVKGLSYIVAQAIGSVLGGLLVVCLNYDGKGYGPALATMSEAAKKIQPEAVFWKETTWYQGGLVETLNTFFLMLVVLSFTQKKGIPKSAFGGAIGLVLTCLICGSGPLTGCAANPFRALGPCIFSNNWFDLLIYETFPFLGAIIASFVFGTLLEDEVTDFDNQTAAMKLNDVKGEFDVNAGSS